MHSDFLGQPYIYLYRLEYKHTSAKNKRCSRRRANMLMCLTFPAVTKALHLPVINWSPRERRIQKIHSTPHSPGNFKVSFFLFAASRKRTVKLLKSHLKGSVCADGRPLLCQLCQTDYTSPLSSFLPALRREEGLFLAGRRQRAQDLWRTPLSAGSPTPAAAPLFFPR